MGIMEKKMETTIMYKGIYRDHVRVIRDILGLYGDNGKEKSKLS